MGAAVQIVGDAINRSRSHNETVTIDVGPSGLVCGADVGADAVCDLLFAECDGEVKNGTVHEYWGTTTNDDDDEETWRVHVEVAADDLDGGVSYSTGDACVVHRSCDGTEHDCRTSSGQPIPCEHGHMTDDTCDDCGETCSTHDVVCNDTECPIHGNV